MRGLDQPPSGGVLPDADAELAFENPSSVRSGNTQTQRLAQSVQTPSDLAIVRVHKAAEFGGPAIPLDAWCAILEQKGSQHVVQVAVGDDLGGLIHHATPLLTKPYCDRANRPSRKDCEFIGQRNGIEQTPDS
jgi:hypothetical protein